MWRGAAWQRLLRGLGAIIVVVLVLWGRGVWGQTTGGASSPGSGAPGDAGSGASTTVYAPVTVNGRVIIQVAGDPRSSAANRAARIMLRLQRLIASTTDVRPFTPQDVHPSGADAIVYLGNVQVVTVTPQDALNAQTTTEALGLVWGAKLSQAVVQARVASAHPLRGTWLLVVQSFRQMIVSGIQWLPKLAGALFLIVVFALLAVLARAITSAVAQRTHLDPNLRQLARALSYYVTWVIGIVAALAVLGFQTGSVVTAFGISGFVLGFAFKDILSHFLAGLMLLIGRQLRIGDQIVVNTYEGTVERIELRALYLRTYDNRLVIIPNGDVFTSAITSNTASPHRRYEFIVGIGYENDLTKAKDLALQAIKETEGVLADPPPEITISELANSAVNLRVWFYTGSLRGNYIRIGSEGMQRVKEAFERGGISASNPGTNTVSLVEADKLAGAIRQLSVNLPRDNADGAAPAATGTGSNGAALRK